MRIPVRGTAPCAFLVALFLALFAGGVSAQETGKIEGRVTDQGGQPIVGAQVVIVGTRYGNITNPQGYYFINNVPAGLQDIQAQFIGYQTVTVRQTRVLAGQTLTQNFSLSQSAVAVQAIEVVGERTPLVPRDQVASKNIVTGDQIAQLPVDNPTRLVVLQPGVVESNRRASGVSIRGGRAGEEAVFVDGVLVKNFSNAGFSGLVVGTNAVSELDILTGGFSAQFGDAQSGIINFVTRSGTRSWTGAASVQSDEMMPKKYSIGYNRGELSFGGPLFGNLGFFAAGTAQGQRSANAGKFFRDVPIYVPEGVDTVLQLVSASAVDGRNDVRDVTIPNFVLYDQGGRIPYTNSDTYTLDGKLDFSYGSGSRIFLTGKTSRFQRRGCTPNLNTLCFGPTTFIYSPTARGGLRNNTQALILGITHNFVRSAESELSLDLKLSISNDRVLSGTLAHDFELEHRDPTLGFTVPDMVFLVDDDCKGKAGCTQFPVNDQLIDNMLHNTGNSAPFLGRQDIRNVQEFRMNPYGTLTDFPTAGGNAIFAFNSEKDKQARATVDWQAGRFNRIRFGGDYTDINVRNASITYNDLFGGRAYVENPKRASLFAQDRVDLGDLVVEAGIRWDRFDPNSVFPNLPGYYDVDAPDCTVKSPLTGEVFSCGFSEAPAETSISPRLGVSFPVTVNSTFRLSYGHFTQVPELNFYYRGKNIDYFRFKNTNNNDVFGRPLALGKTIAFEFGYRQLLAPDFVLDIAAYNKTKLQDIAVRNFDVPDPTRGGALTPLNQLTTQDFGVIRGIDARLDRRFGRLFQAMLAYSFQDARNTGTDPLTYTQLFARIESNANAALGIRSLPPQGIRATEENRKHNVTSTFALTVPNDWSGPSVLHNFGAFGTVRVASGLPFTMVDNVGQAYVTGPPTSITSGTLDNGDIGTGRTPWLKEFDLKITRGFQIGRFSAQAFADARNLLDITNVNSVFLTTGGTTDEVTTGVFVSSYQRLLGGGTIRDVNLTNATTAGGGVKDNIDLYLLQQAEARFGDGNRQFTVAEQAKAFRDAVLFSNAVAGLSNPGRRVRLGIDLTF